MLFRSKVTVEMRGFSTETRDMTVAEEGSWTLKMVPMAELTSTPAAAVRVAEAPKVEIKRPANVAAPAATNTTSGFQNTRVQQTANSVAATEVASDVAQRANDGLVVNGSVNNAASSPFSQLPAFGNNRIPGRWPYNGNFGVLLDNSALDARPFSLTGKNTVRPAYTKMTGFATIGGPIRIPGLLRNGPQFTLNYQWTRNRNVTTQTGLMPTQGERAGDFSQTLTPLGNPVQVLDPLTKQPLPGNLVPLSRISDQALKLLPLFPLPNFNGQARYNFQVPIVSGMHQDAVQFRSNRQFGRKDNLTGTLMWQKTRTDTPNLYGFLANGRMQNLQTNVNWRHNFTSRFYVSLGYQFSRSSNRNIPFFSKIGRAHV